MCKPRETFFKEPYPKLHNISPGIDRNRALEQFDCLEKTLKSFRVEILHISELNNHPNSVFVRDTAAIIGKGFIRLRMGLETRRGEEEWMANFLRNIGYKELGKIVSPGTAEGGDIVIGENIAFVGISNRTNEEGAKQVSDILQSLGIEVRATKFKGPFLHIGGAMSLVGRNIVLHCEGAFPKNFFEGFTEIPIQCNDFIGGNVIGVSEDTAIVPVSNKPAISAFSANSIKPYIIDISEFVKGNGGPSCMVLPIK